MSYEIELPESGKLVPLKSLTRAQVREVDALRSELLAGGLGAVDYQDKVLALAYPDLGKEDVDGWPGADVGHLVRVTVDYSMLGPESVKNSLRSGSGRSPA